MKINQVKGNTFCIDTGMTYIPFYKINDKEIIMLDSGWANGEREGIDKVLEKNKFKVAAIICSHAHIDHIGNNLHLKNKYNCIIAMPEYEALACSSAVNLKLYYNDYSLSGIEEHFGHMICKTDIMISNTQSEIYVCGIKFNVIHTPGHSPAHICIITPDDAAYMGDVLISYEVMEGAKMPYAYVLAEDLRSKEKLYNLKHSKYIVAHKGIYNDITKLITDNINFYKNRAMKIYDLIDNGMTMEEILRTVVKEFNIPIHSIHKHIVMKRILRSYIEYLRDIEAINFKLDMDEISIKLQRRILK